MKRMAVQIFLLVIAIASPAFAQDTQNLPQDAKAARSDRDKGKAYLDSGRYHEAVEAFKQAVRVRPDDAEAHHGLGLAYQGLKQSEAAVASFGEAIRLKPDWAEAHSNLGVTYRSMGRLREAVDSLKRAVQLKPNWAVPHNHLGVLYLNAGQYEEAIQSLKEALRLKPDWAEAHNNLGVAYTKSSQAFLAIAPLEEAIRLKPNWAEPYNNLGVAYAKTAQFKEAVNAFKEAVRLKPDWPQAHLNLGVAYLKAGDRQKALEERDILQTTNPDLASELNVIIEEPSRVLSGGVLNGRAISLPKPDYPATAKAARAAGVVTVQVTIDEEGKVIAAKAISGHPLLHGAAVAAAREARFTSTKLEGRPVKVTGVITYNFVGR